MRKSPERWENRSKPSAGEVGHEGKGRRRRRGDDRRRQADRVDDLQTTAHHEGRETRRDRQAERCDVMTGGKGRASRTLLHVASQPGHPVNRHSLTTATAPVRAGVPKVYLRELHSYTHTSPADDDDVTDLSKHRHGRPCITKDDGIATPPSQPANDE